MFIHEISLESGFFGFKECFYERIFKTEALVIVYRTALP